MPARASGETSGPSPRPTFGPTRQLASSPSRGTLDSRSIEVLREALASSDFATRILVVEAVGAAGGDAFLGWLEHALGDPEPDVRAAAIEALGRLGSAGALALLVTVRDDGEEALDLRALAASFLLKSPGPSSPRPAAVGGQPAYSQRPPAERRDTR
jgi:HEAT repeat protein